MLSDTSTSGSFCDSSVQSQVAHRACRDVQPMYRVPTPDLLPTAGACATSGKMETVSSTGAKSRPRTALECGIAGSGRGDLAYAQRTTNEPSSGLSRNS